MTAIDGRRYELKRIKPPSLQHASLLLDKMLVWHDAPIGTGEEEAANKEALRALLEAARIEVPEGYRRAFDRRRALVERFTGGVERGATQARCAATKGRLVVNLGAASVRETNIALLHTWGVPYIPGTALKGLASAAAHRSGVLAWRKPDHEKKLSQGEDHRLLFGDHDESGCVVFHDAWWAPEGDKVPLDLDTMTVHHRGYYQGAGTPPADHDEPNPVAFLTTRGTFLIALSGPDAWLDAAFDWLGIGLKDDGVGAKTAAGYGRMILDISPRQREKEEREAAEQRQREEEKRRVEATRRRLAELIGLFRGKPNARQIFEELQSIAADSALHDDVRQALRLLYAKDEACWRDWLKRKANTEQQALAEQFQMMPVGSLKNPAPSLAPAPARQGADAWERGQAWIASDHKNRVTLCFIGATSRKPEERNRKDVMIEEQGLEQALRAAGPDAPIEVEGLRDGKRITGVRRPGGGG